MNSLTDVIDSVPFDSLPDVEVPDFSAVGDAFSDASTVVADTAVVLGRRGGRLATRTANSAWKNRETVATVAVVVVVFIAIASLLKRKAGDDSDES